MPNLGLYLTTLYTYMNPSDGIGSARLRDNGCKMLNLDVEDVLLFGPLTYRAL